MNMLVVDDNAHRITFFQNALKGHKVTVCRHARAAIKALRKSSFDVVFLDHDLEGRAADPDEENCGSEIARFIAEHQVACGRIILHTENSAGRDSMESILDNAESIPYGRLKKMGMQAVLKAAIAPDEETSE
jgi:CheY-like chemotaxis protein